MLTITLEFDAETALLLPSAASRRRGLVVRRLPGPTSVKDAVEGAGVPHCEVGQVRADGVVCGLDRLLAADTSVRVEAAGPRDPGEARFLCDGHLGGLVRRLRGLGLDTTWNPDWTEAEVARRGLREERIVLSGSRALLKRRTLERAMLIRDSRPDEQAAAVVRRWLLADRARPLTRCLLCNGLIRSVPRAAVADRIPPRTAAWLDEYRLCDGCGRLYWAGTHVAALRRRLQAILAAGHS